MYFSNIHNRELQHFHGSTGVDFTMSLTDMLESDLFEIENIGNNIYRVFPLFYCKTIISSNSNDKILDTRCLILTKRENETYLSFRTQQANTNTIFDPSILNSKKINETLSMDEFNAMVYMLRSKNNLSGTVNFEDSTIFNGGYATYELHNSEDIAINDIGFIITPELKRNPLTIKLTNPFFLKAKYDLTCTVKCITGANVCDIDDADFKTEDTFTVTLIENQEVSLDINQYVDDSVLLFDMHVNVSFDVPEIVNGHFELSLDSDKTSLFIGGTINLTATLSGGVNIGGYTVQFFEDNVLIGTETTDSKGIAELEYTPDLGTHVYSCSVFGLTDAVTVSISKYHSNLTLASDKNIAYIPTSFTLSGVLTDERGTISNANVLLYNNNSLLATVTTDNNGEFSHTVTVSSPASFSLQAKFEDTTSIIGANSSYVQVTARKLNTNLTINTNRNTVYFVSQYVTITGVLTDELNNKMTNTSVSLYMGNGLWGSTTTDSNGAYEFNPIKNSEGTVNYKVSYPGDTPHNNTTSATKSVTYQKAPTSITTDKSSYDVGETIKIIVNSSYGRFNPSSVSYELYRDDVQVAYGTLSEKTNGYFTWTVPSMGSGDYILKVNYNGDSYYSASSLTKNIYINGLPSPTTLTVSKNGSYVVMNYKANGVNLQNFAVIGTQVHLGNVLVSINTGATDSNGNLTMQVPSIQSGDKIYFTYGDLTSNTITW